MNKVPAVILATAGLFCAGCASNPAVPPPAAQKTPSTTPTDIVAQDKILRDLDALIRRATEDCERGKAQFANNRESEGALIKTRCDDIAAEGNAMIAFAAGYLHTNTWDKKVIYHQGELVDSAVTEVEVLISKPKDFRSLGSVMGDLLYQLWQGWHGASEKDRDTIADLMRERKFLSYDEIGAAP